MCRVSVRLRLRDRFVLALALAFATSCSSAFGQQTLYWSSAGLGAIQSAPVTATGAGAVSTYAGGLASPNGIAFDSNGDLFVAGNQLGNIYEITPNDASQSSINFAGGPNGLYYCYGLAVDANNNVYLADQHSEILEFSPTATPGTYTKTQYASASSTIFDPYALVFDSQGNLYSGDEGQFNAGQANIYKIGPGGGTPNTFATGLSEAYGLAIDAHGDVWASNYLTGTIEEFDSSGNPLGTPITGLNDPKGLAFDANGDLWVAETGAGKIDEYSISETTATFVSSITGLSSPNFVAFPQVPAAINNAWTGATSTVWTVSTNWSGAIPGATSGTTSTDTVTFNAYNATNPAPVVDMNRNVQNVTFDNSAGNLTGSITFGSSTGKALLLTSGGTIQTTTTVALPQSVDAPLVLEGGDAYTFASNAATSTATLNFGGAITAAAAGTTLMLTGANTGANTISGALGDGGGNLAVTASSGAWTLTAANTYSGATTVSGGTLTIGNGASGSLGGQSAITVSGGTLAVADSGPFGAPAISISGNGTFTNSSGANVAVSGGAVSIADSGVMGLSGTSSLTATSIAINGGSLTVAGAVSAPTISMTGGSLTAGGAVSAPSISISGGVFTLTSGGSFTGNPAISVSGTGFLAVQPGSGTLTIGSTATPSAGATLSVTSGGTFSMADGAVGTVNLQQGTGFGAALTLDDGTLNFDLGSGGADKLAVSHGTASVSGTNTIGVAPIGAIAAGNYTLISAPSGLSGTYQFPGGAASKVVGATLAGPFYQLSLTNSDTAVSVSVAPVQVATQTLYWSAYSAGSIQSAPVTAAGAGTVSTYASGMAKPDGIAFDSNGNLFVSGNSVGNIYMITPGAASQTAITFTLPGSSSPQTTGLYYCYDLAIDASDNLYMADQRSEILKFTATAPATYTATQFYSASPTTFDPYGLAFDSQGNLYSGDEGQFKAGNANVYKIAPNGASATTFATGLSDAFGLAFDTHGDLWVANYLSGSIEEFNSSGALLGTPITGLNEPEGLAFDANGNLWIAEFGAGNMDEYSISGNTATLASQITGLSGPAYLAFQFTFSSGGSYWTGTAGDSTWATAGNWSGNVPGSTSGTTNTDTALFNQTVSSSPTIIDMGGRNLMNITFDTANVSQMTIGATTGPTLILTSGGTIQTTSTVTTPQVVNAPLQLEGNYTFTSGSTTPAATLSFGGAIMPDSSLTSTATTLTLNGSNGGANTISGVLSDNGSAQLALAVGGTGVWLLSGATSTYSGGTTIANGATLQLAGSASVMSQAMSITNSGSLIVASSTTQKVGVISGSGSVAVNSGSLTAYEIRQSSLTIGASATVTLSASGSGSVTDPQGPNNTNFSSNVTSLSIAGGMNAWTGTLDIGNNGLVIQYGAPANDPFATIENMVESGYAGGDWNGKGITSSLAAAATSSNHPLNIGLEDFTPGKGVFANESSIVFEGQTITTNAVLVRLTYMDDLVLAGDMSQDDATDDALLFAANYGVGTTWSVGDITHDGSINSNDALLFAANYGVGFASLDGTTGADVALGGAAAVPEPAGAALAVCGICGAIGILTAKSRKAPRLKRA